ncbi:MAG: DNA repair protein RecO [Candidatus Moranbacteria bacterium]|jgi:DNA repair protein RecO (recombination protein O)|nr:DNA repair protein RecO [Candidatus Moranbacteria bacterium]MBP9801389.1 DNA repair protein RecO [Candidatus Moranbacteria bacterium]
MEYRYTAIVLKKREIGETDRLYTFYTKEQGKVRAVAKGIRKSGAKLASQLENGMLADVAVARTRGTGKITGALAEEQYPKLRNQLEGLRAVLATLDRFERLVQFDEPDEQLYFLLANFLRYAEKSAAEKNQEIIRLLGPAFLFQAIARLGYAMEARVSAVSGQKFLGHERFFFSAAQGGIVFSSECGENPSFPVSKNAVKLLRVFQEHPLLAVTKIRVSEKDVREIERAIQYLVEWVL